jgi:hypothetical protein
MTPTHHLSFTSTTTTIISKSSSKKSTTEGTARSPIRATDS